MREAVIHTGTFVSGRTVKGLVRKLATWLLITTALAILATLALAYFQKGIGYMILNKIIAG